jgi:hypothetical protein
MNPGSRTPLSRAVRFNARERELNLKPQRGGTFCGAILHFAFCNLHLNGVRHPA